MKDTGIRDFCTNICKGHCCQFGCFTSDKACHKNEGRRLGCSVFLCGCLQCFIFTDKELDIFHDITTIVENELYEAMEGVSPYFHINTPQNQSRVNISKEVLKNLSKIKKKRVRKKIHKLKQIIDNHEYGLADFLLGKYMK